MQSKNFILRTHRIHTLYIGVAPYAHLIATSWLVHLNQWYKSADRCAKSPTLSNLS